MACTYNRACLFGDVTAEELRFNDAGQVVKKCWLTIPDHFLYVEFDALVITPTMFTRLFGW